MDYDNTIYDWNVAEFPNATRIEIVELAHSRNQIVSSVAEEFARCLLHIQRPEDLPEVELEPKDATRALWHIVNFDVALRNEIVACTIRWRRGRKREDYITVAEYMERAFRFWNDAPKKKGK